jgi:inner membrane transporter RhtA
MVVCVALFSAAIAYLFEYLALKSMPPRQFGVLVALEPAVAALVGAFALAQLMGIRAWLAIILISTAAMITSMMATDSTPKDRESG